MKKKTVALILLIIGLCMLITGIVLSFIDKSKSSDEENELTEEEIVELKKEIINSMSKYMYALTYEVNDLTYNFTEENTIFAVPIECIQLKGVKENHLGIWKPSSDNYWAYVLIQYDEATYSYNYGFTFKDSEGYGMYPISAFKITEDGSQIQKDLKLSKPKKGLISEITPIENWEGKGFNFNEETKLVALEPTEKGDNIATCTIQ